MNVPRNASRIALALLSLAVCSSAGAQSSSFQCGATKPDATHHQLTATSLYKTPAPGTPASGFDLSTVPTTFADGACSSNQPFFFSLAVPDGNYRVTLVLGGPQASNATVRAESRRLFLDQKSIPAGKSFTISFNVNVRTATIVSKGAPTSDKPL